MQQEQQVECCTEDNTSKPALPEISRVRETNDGAARYTPVIQPPLSPPPVTTCPPEMELYKGDPAVNKELGLSGEREDTSSTYTTCHCHYHTR